MRAVRIVTGVGCALVALVALLLAWIQEPPELDADDASTVARRSLDAVGFEQVEVAAPVERRTYEPAAGGEVPAWRTVSTVEGGTVELWVAVADGAALYLLDRTEDGTGQLLTDDQFEALSAVRVTPTEDHQQRRNVAATVAAAGVVLTTVGLLTAGIAPRPPAPASTARPLRADSRSGRR